MSSQIWLARAALALISILTAAAPAQTAPATRAAATTAPANKPAASSETAGWTVIFRADDPALWNTDAGDPSARNGFAARLEKVPADMRYLRLKRLDTGDAVIIPLGHDEMMKVTILDGDVEWRPASGPLAPGDASSGQLLGIARRSWTTAGPNQHLVVMRAGTHAQGYRGWGFSKPTGRSNAQSYSWAGQPIDRTPFEVAVKVSPLDDAERPLLLTDEQKVQVTRAVVARVDRDPKLKQAIDLFGEVQETLKKSPEQIHYKPVREKLAKVAELAPNHFSAKLLLLVAQDRQPRRLSSGASIYYTAVAIRNVLPVLAERAKAMDRQQVTPAAVKEGLRSLDHVRRVADPSVIPLVDAWRDFIQTISDAQSGTASLKTLENKAQRLEDAAAKLNANRDVMEKLLREGV